MKSKKIFFLLRFASVVIDLSVIYCLDCLIRVLLSPYRFFEFSVVFIASFLFYYALFNGLLDGRSPGRALTGIKVIQAHGADIKWTNILMREVVLKGLLGILLPVYYFEYIAGKQSWLLALLIFVVIFLLSTLILLTFKRQWWEIFSGTTTTVKSISSRFVLKGAFSFVTVISLAGIIVIIYPALKGSKKDFGTEFYPRYPTTNETRKYTTFIKSNAEPPVDYIFNLFKKYDIVVISERMHPEYTQYQFFADIVKDKRFSKNIGNIFTECGSVSFQDTLNTYLHSTFASEDLLNKNTAFLQRNSNAIWPLWDNTNLFDFFKTVYHLNRLLPDSSKINWYFTDTNVDWRNMTHAKFLKAYTNLKRDSIMAAHIIQEYQRVIVKQMRKKALVIMNSRHGYGLIAEKYSKTFRVEYNTGTTSYLEKALPGKVANVMMNTFSIKYSLLFAPVQHGKWDAAFSDAGDPEVGFNFNGSPFGNDKFDLAFASTPGLTYKNVFTGFVFFKPLDQHIKKQGFPYEFTDFEDTILKRASFVDQGEVATFRNLIAYQKQTKNPIDSGPIPYALFYNAILVIIAPAFVLISLLVAIILYLKAARRTIYLKTIV